MNPDPTAPAALPEQIFPVRFKSSASTANLEFKGEGELAISGDRLAYIFTGPSRAFFSSRRKTLAFTSADISDVVQDGAHLSFTTGVGQHGQQGRRFEFQCADAAAATAVRALLPTRLNADFVATQDFAARLRQLPAASSWFTSVTGLIIMANVAVFVVLAAFFDAGWIEVDSMTAYFRYANNGAATTGGEWWRLLTSAFMHYGLLHLALNMWALFSIGQMLERLLGRTLYLLLYLASALGGSLLSIAWHGDHTWSAGASGAIFGLYGGLLGYVLRQKQSMPPAVLKPLQKSALTFAGYNLVYGMIQPGIDNADHIGGLIAGLALGWLIAVPVDLTLRPALIRKNFRLGLVVTALVVVAACAALPRYSYRVADEVAWDEAVKGLVEKESTLLKQDNDSRSHLTTDVAARTKYAAWLNTELVPFYDQWAGQLAAQHYTPGLLTERRRLALLEYSRLQADAYRHLVIGAKDDSAEEIKTYRTLSTRANETIRNFKP